jgi:hypothetical protein
MAPEHFVSDSDQSKPTVLTGLSLAELDPNQSDMWVTAVGIAPQYNADRQLYYFDIVLDPGDTYFPFVRLALARLQPHSLTDAYLSRVVRADFAQLVADRTATITYNGKTSVDVVVAGITAKNELAAQVQSGMIAVAALGPGGGMVANPSVGKGHLVRAFVQSRTDPKQGDLGWKTVGAVRALSPYSVSIAPSTAYWRGTVTLPGTIGDGAEYRLAVEELEIYETDSASAESGLEVTTANNVPVRSRLVYFDALPLSP